MKTRVFLLVVAGLIVVLWIFFLLIPNTDAVRYILVKTTISAVQGFWGATLLGIVCLGPGFFGHFVRKQIIPKIDESISPDLNLTGQQKFFLAILFSLILGVIWLIFVPIAANNSVVHGVFMFFAPGWNGHYEVAPLLWGAIAAAASLIVYVIGSM